MSSRAKRLWRAILSTAILVLGSLWAREALAEIPLCIDVRAPAAELDGLRKLVRSEVDRHPSHKAATAECRASLAVELFDAAGARYLTAQIDREVPVRFTIKDPIELGERVTEAVKLCLHNDPVYLTEDITHYSKLQRLGHSIGAGGRSTFRVELFEAISRAGTNTVFSPGAAFAFTRGSGHWQVLARGYLGGWPASVPRAERALQMITGADGGLTFELLEKAFASPYLSACLGVQYLRFVGREQPMDKRVAFVNHLGVSASVRLGARFFRWNRFDLDLFAQGYLPFFVTKDVDGSLFGEKGLYTPSVQLGLGVGF